MAKRPTEPISPDNQELAGMFAMMLEYLKQVHKEAREDKKAARRAKEVAQHARETKNALDSAAIEQAIAEAGEMADHVREAARAAILSGEVSAGSVFTITLPKGAGIKSELLRRQMLDWATESQKADGRAEEADNDADYSRDRRREAIERIQKLLDIIAAINPRI